MKRFLSALLGSVAFLAAVAVFVCLAVLAEPPLEEKQTRAFAVAEEELPAIPATDNGSVAALARVFGAPLFSPLDTANAGQVRNASFEGKMARVATLDFGTLAISAVRPAAAAPLLLREKMTVSMRDDLAVLNMPALYAQDGDARCLYFSDDSVAYSVFAPDMSEADFFTLAARLSAVRP